MTTTLEECLILADRCDDRGEFPEAAKVLRARGCGQTLREWVADSLRRCPPNTSPPDYVLASLQGRFGDLPLPTDERIPAPKPGALERLLGAAMRARGEGWIPRFTDLAEAINAIRAGGLPECEPWDGWTRVEDGLPPPVDEGDVHSSYVLAYAEAYTVEAYFEYESGRWFLGSNGRALSGVTHWRPLPKPPEQP